MAPTVFLQALVFALKFGEHIAMEGWPTKAHSGNGNGREGAIMPYGYGVGFHSEVLDIPTDAHLNGHSPERLG